MTAPIDLLPWQPIETAPKDGTPIIVRFGRSVRIVSWNRDGDRTWSTIPGDWRLSWNPTHWLDISDREPTT